jgi:SOS-response transcriptional repressors (RecA-mediated autopeptidases)
MSTFAERLNQALEMKNISPAELSRATGIGEGAISQYRKGAYKATQRNLDKIAKALAVSIPWLMGAAANTELISNIGSMPSMRKVPRLGTIACGTPILAEQNFGSYDTVPDFVNADFTLICKGDSMINARIYDGDIVCIRQQDMVDDGDIAAVLIDNEATLKRVHFFPDHIVLEPANPMYEPLSFWREKMNDVHIIGKATHFISCVR